ncbi:FtsX-like permease family protein [Streptomyces sp. MP131-18]|uniref:FtsX-like permease family protein n=1 Tax=Streptomyces sp. MP131-18 TaxID=1857892 RepID=UPI00097CB8DF|nr:FtsX-like permease family protein [Streptomyces sp. MP131-18]ONK11781.1 FtsX-like permease family protein [Streptomyces sp. MP131-18]
MSGGGRVSSWARELAVGARFALAGGPGWTRTLLTAAGVGLGVVVLLLAASVPHAVAERNARGDARSPASLGEEMPPGPDTVQYISNGTEYRGDSVGGMLLRPDAGADTTAEPPPGLDAFPAPGEMAVSPALGELLDSPEGELLAERFDHRRAGTIGAEGLKGPNELMYYAGAEALPEERALRTDAFGVDSVGTELPPVLVLLIVVICVVLLMPVAVFMATAVRFGGERRDQRLAALRLLGADTDMTRRIAAGEALVGALFGLVAGVGAFLALRQFLGSITVWEFSTYPGDIVPSPLLLALILVAVPVSAVVASLLALRGIAIEPLGVVRESSVPRRRLMWRLAPGVLGLLLLLPFVGSFDSGSSAEQGQVATGVVLLLAGTTVLLPWLVERVVGRLRGGPVSWQLATRRLQLSSGAAARTVSGITVAVAGAIALHMLFFGARTDQTVATGDDPDRAQIEVSRTSADGGDMSALVGRLESVPGVTDSFGSVVGDAVTETGDFTPVLVADCGTLRESAVLDSCANGDVFIANSGDVPESRLPAPGERLNLAVSWETGEAAGEPRWWTVPETAPLVESRPDASGQEHVGILATPAAIDPGLLADPWTEVLLRVDPHEADVIEHVRNVAWETSPPAQVWELESERVSDELLQVQQALLVGATGIMLLIGASMIVSMFEQLRERRRLLSALVAFGTRRGTLAASVLWQTAVPVGLGLAVAAVVGTGLGALLMSMAGLRLGGWLAFLPMAGAGAATIALVTLVSLPLLWRLMRPDGLRTE